MKAYLSSTYDDLVDYRDRAYRALRSLRFDVIAMEDYVATDERPIDRCLADIESVDVYVGLFAFRYGYIPEVDNPDSRSITELEYRHAVTKGIPRLIFRVPDKSRWEIQFLDAITGEGDKGESIGKLRDELGKERLMGEFRTPDQLFAAVTTSASNWLLAQREISSTAASVSSASYSRQLRFDLLLLHAPSDGDTASELKDALSDVWRVTTSGTGLVAASGAELEDLDRLAASARSAAVLLSPSALTILAEDQARSRRALGLARDRTGELLGFASEEVAADAAETWQLTDVVGPPSTTDAQDISGLANLLHSMLAQHLTTEEVPEIGLPVVVVTMNAREAKGLLANPPEPVAALLNLAGDSSELWTARYGESRLKWRPFADTNETIEQVLAAATAAVNRDANYLQGRRIRLQPYPFDALLTDNLLMWRIYQGIARTGSLVVVDELSLFCEKVRQAFKTSPLPAGEQVAFVTLSPLDPTAVPPHTLIRQKLDGYLEQAAQRFSNALDPLCEMGIPERRRLDRWLHGSLPRTVEALREAKRDPDKLRELAEELGAQANPAMGRLIAGERGPG